MNRMSRRKRSYGVIVISVLAIAVVFGFLFDLVCSQIERMVYPKPEEYKEYVEKYSKEYGVSENLIYAVIKTESGFDSSAVSNKGATGLMQIMPETFEWLTDDILHEYLDNGMLYDPETNIKYGTYYLSRLYGRFGDWNTAIAAYNGGEGNVSEVNISIREVVETVLKRKAVCVVIAHNHPDGVAVPSREDVAVTRNIKNALSHINIKLVDHIVIGGDDYVSLAQSRLFCDIFD